MIYVGTRSLLMLKQFLLVWSRPIIERKMHALRYEFKYKMLVLVTISYCCLVANFSDAIRYARPFVASCYLKRKMLNRNRKSQT